jgi:SAM-dependent methyltransferase
MDLPQFAVHAALEERHWWFQGRLAILRALLHRLLPPDGTKLLIDVGCGTGGVSAALAEEYRCIGIDPVTPAIESARTRFPSVDFRVGTAPADVPEMAEADGVLLMDVLEHLADDFFVVSSLLAAMKAGALLFIVAPAETALWGQHDRGFDCERRYEIPRLRILWEGLPMEEVLVSYCNTRLYPVAKIVRALSRLLGKSLGKADTDLSLPAAPVNRLLLNIFEGERNRILNVVENRAKPYPRGTSVIAVLRRAPGVIVPRSFPPHFPKDPTPWRE